MRNSLALAAAIGAAALCGCTEDGDTIIIQQVASTTTPPPPPPAFSLTSSAPSGGPTGGGTTVVITGVSIDSGASVTFGGTAASSVTVVSSTSILATSPAGTGTVDIAVTSSGNTETLTGAFTYDSPPNLVTSLAAGTRALIGDDLNFTVTATEPGGNNVTITLLNPPPGIRTTAATNIASPGVMTVDWNIRPTNGGLQHLYFRAEDATSGSGQLLVVTVSVTGAATRTSSVVADVTNDGVLDLIVSAVGKDAATASDVGALYVFSGQTQPLGAPTAVLWPAANPLPGTQMGFSSGQSVQVADVTGDGILDIVAGAQNALANGVAQAGAIYVFAGGSGLSGTVTPTATLALASPTAQDWLTRTDSGNGYVIADVTGDSNLDIVAGGRYVDGGAVNSGGVYMWSGGTAMTGNRAPTASLLPAAPTANDWMTYVPQAQGIQACDVNNDGTNDVIVGGYAIDANAVDDGAVYVWRGGAGLTGTVAPNYTCEVATPTNQDYMGYIVWGQGVLCCEVTGDSFTDIVVGGYAIDGNATDSGAVYVFAGAASLAGAVNPTTTLEVAAPTANDWLARGLQVGAQSLLCCEVTGDTNLDIVVASPYVDANGTDDGAIYVFAGGGGAAQIGNGGTMNPTTTCEIATPTNQDWLTRAFQGRGVKCCDVTGDGTDDLVAAAPYADVGVANSGALYLFIGGTGAGTIGNGGTLNPNATLVAASPVAQDYLSGVSGDAIVCCEVTGDAILDIVSGSYSADNGTVQNTGAGYVWAGRAAGSWSGSTTPTATLQVTGAAQWDNLTNGTGHGIQCCDLTNDGTLDLVLAARSADILASNDGAVYVWAGGASLTGTPAPLATLTHTFSVSQSLGNQNGEGVRCVDVTGDGVPDVLAGSQWATIAGVSSGFTAIWAGGTGMTGTPAPTATLYAVTTSDYTPGGLGNGIGLGLPLADLNGDGVCDVAGVSTSTGQPLTANSHGAVFLWHGGAGLTGTQQPHVVLTAATRYPNDQLGN